MELLTKSIQNSLDLLHFDKKPVFGKMTSQHMVEHLIITIELSIGKIGYPPFEPSQKALNAKQSLLFSSQEMPMGMTAPNDSGILLPLKYPSLKLAKNALMTAWQEFHSYFEANSDVKHVHPRFGLLDYHEWQRFHFKHMMHHFKQFEVWEK